MRLSDIKGDAAMDAVARIVPHVIELAGDKQLLAVMSAQDEDGGRKLGAVIAALVPAHTDQVVGILAAINGKSDDEYRSEMTIGSLIRDLTELLTDEDMTSFLA